MPADEQGKLQGGFTSLMSLSFIIGPFVMSSVLFAAFTREGAGVFSGGLCELLQAW